MSQDKFVLSCYHGTITSMGDINATDTMLGYTPLIAAIAGDQLDSIQFLIEQKADTSKNNPLYYALSKESVQLLLDAKVDINVKNELGQTKLMEVVSHDAYSLNFIKFLLSKKADSNIKDITGRSALDMTGNEDIIKLLIVIPEAPEVPMIIE